VIKVLKYLVENSITIVTVILVNCKRRS